MHIQLHRQTLSIISRPSKWETSSKQETSPSIPGGWLCLPWETIFFILSISANSFIFLKIYLSLDSLRVCLELRWHSQYAETAFILLVTFIFLLVHCPLAESHGGTDRGFLQPISVLLSVIFLMSIWTSGFTT